jgi:hypothetical protein
MKKIIALLCLAVLVAALLIPVCVSAKQSCPECLHGALLSVTYTQWETKSAGKRFRPDGFCEREYHEERTRVVKCTKTTHRITETKNSRWVLCSPYF